MTVICTVIPFDPFVIPTYVIPQILRSVVGLDDTDKTTMN